MIMNKTIIKKLIFSFTFLWVFILSSFISTYSVRANFEKALVEKMFEIPLDAKLPESLKKYEKIQYLGNQSVQTFEVIGNLESDRTLIIYPGLKGVYYYVEAIATNSQLLNYYSKIITFNYQSQGLTSGKPSQQSIVELGQVVYNHYSNTSNKTNNKTNSQTVSTNNIDSINNNGVGSNYDNITLACLSNGAIPCTYLRINPNTKVKLIHPFLSSSCIIDNIYTNYYDYDKLLKTWLQAKRSLDDTKRVEMIKERKDWLKSIYPMSKQAEFLYVNTKIGPNFQVYIANQDDYFTTPQNLEFFPKAEFTGAISHTEISEEKLQNILMN